MVGLAHVSTKLLGKRDDEEIDMDLAFSRAQEEIEPWLSDLDDDAADDFTADELKEIQDAWAKGPDRARAAVLTAARVMLQDAIRRMATRVAGQASRAAKDAGKYCGWLDSFADENRVVVDAALWPAAEALRALGASAESPTDWLLARLRSAWGALADSCTPAALPAAAEGLAAELAERLPAEAAETFLEGEK
jgi:hypothetical protein